LGNECDRMKKAAKWLSVISIVVFIIDWGVMGVKLLDNDYRITAEAYIGQVCLVIFFVSIMYLTFTNRCPHCRKIKQPFWKYCPYCGKELN